MGQNESIFSHLLRISFSQVVPHEYGSRMAKQAIVHQALICGALCGVTASVSAQSVSEYAVLVSAQVQTNPSQVQLSWPADGQASGYRLYRKLRDDTEWGAGLTLAANATNYTDTNVAVGGAYEYRCQQIRPKPCLFRRRLYLRGHQRAL